MIAAMDPSLNPPKANRIVGYITGILTFTPYERWKHDHSIPTMLPQATLTGGVWVT